MKNGEFDDQLVYKKLLQEAGHQVDRDIFYIYTRRGLVPVELDHDDIDYQHYIDMQVRPIAEVVLLPLEMTFDNIVTGNQLDFFL